jgi:hypothetical protein
VRVRLALAVLVLVAAVPACGTDEQTLPRCRPDRRLGLVAQSVPGAAYVPCIDELPAGWSVASVTIDHTGTRYGLRSDRADRTVRVTLSDGCEHGDATAIRPRDEGVRTYQALDRISPTYAGRILDVFPGGCVTYEFDFDRGPHIALLDDLQRAVDLYSRRELRHGLRERLGVSVDI